jgi:3-oxoadipate enol-lactonase
VAGVALVLDEAGAGDRPLLLVHGFTGCRDDFAPVVPALVAAGWHVVAADNRGHGDSAQPPDEADYEIDRFADDVLGLADVLGWDRFTLLGHSLGGIIAQRVVARAPGRIEGLVLMDTTSTALDLDEELVRTGAAIVRAQGLPALLDLLRDADDPLGSPAAERANREIPGHRERGERNARRCSPAMYARLLELFVEPADRSAELAAVGCPTLVVVGAEDARMLGPSRRMAELIPGARLAIVPDAGHSPQFENTAAFTAALLDFLGTAD